MTKNTKWPVLGLVLVVAGVFLFSWVTDPFLHREKPEGIDYRSEYKGDYFQISTTQCLGPCPVYTVTLFEDGALIFVDQSKQEDVETLTTRPAELYSNILDHLEKNDFRRLGRSRNWGSSPPCWTLMTDHPSFKVTLVEGAKDNPFYYYTGCIFSGSEDLQELLYEIRQMLDIDELMGEAVADRWR